MANPTPPGDVVAQLRRTLKDLERRLAELERFDGTQNQGTVVKVTRALDAVSALFDEDGILRADPGIASTDARNRVLTQAAAAAYVDETGRFGISPSSIRFKTDLVPWEVDPTALLGLRAVLFRYITEPEDAPKQLGWIAEELLAAGFPEFVFYDAAGNVQGINYDRVVVALLELNRHQQTQIDDIAQRLTALEGEPTMPETPDPAAAS